MERLQVVVTKLVLGLVFVVAGCAAEAGDDADDREDLSVTQSEILSGTCTSSFTAPQCIGLAYYTSPNGGLSYCDPTITIAGNCALVATGRCSYESVSNCGGTPMGTRCNSGRGSCRRVPGYTDPTPPCGCY